MPQVLDSEDWASIRFEGHDLPQSLMGISVLVSDEHLSDPTGDWLWRLTLCSGVLKTGSSTWCYEAASEVLAFLTDRRADAIGIVEDRLAPFGFDPEVTLFEWTESLLAIRSIAAGMNGECSWIGEI
jgi:hypothetical protein